MAALPGTTFRMRPGAMRVGLFTYGMASQPTGIGRYARELSYAIRAVAPEVEIHLLNPYPESTLSWYRDFPTHPVPSLRRLPAVIAWGSLVLEAAARRLRLDVLHDPCGIAPFLAPRSRTRRVVTVHDAVPYLYPEMQPVGTRVVFRTLVRAARRTADAVITVSASARDDLVKHVGFRPERVHVTPNGVGPISDQDLDVWRDTVPEVTLRHGVSPPYVLYVGAFNRRKNVARLLRAFEEVHRRVPEVQLVLAGPEGGGTQALRADGARLGPAVRFLGYVDDADLHALYVGARVVAVPSLHEGFGLPALEAMAHGAPVVVSRTSAFPEVVGSAALLVDPLDEAALADALCRVLHHGELARRLSVAGRRRATTFTWESTAHTTVAAYRRVCGS